MILNDKTLNNVVNFMSSYLVFQILNNEELQNEFSLFIFNKDRKEVMQDIGQTMIAGKNEAIDENFIFTRQYLVSKLIEFINLKNIKHEFNQELEILLDESVTSISYIQSKYFISFNRASKIYSLHRNLFQS